MDINLEVFNLETDFFGDLHCSSRFTDMLCDAQTQYVAFPVLIIEKNLKSGQGVYSKPLSNL
jgi:hypothetical protein